MLSAIVSTKKAHSYRKRCRYYISAWNRPGQIATTVVPSLACTSTTCLPVELACKATTMRIMQTHTSIFIVILEIEYDVCTDSCPPRRLDIFTIVFLALFSTREEHLRYCHDRPGDVNCEDFPQDLDVYAGGDIFMIETISMVRIESSVGTQLSSM